MTRLAKKITADALRKTKYKSVMFLTFDKGGYQQTWRNVDFPRLHVETTAKTREQKPVRRMFVDGYECSTLTEAIKALNTPPEAWKRRWQLEYGRDADD